MTEVLKETWLGVVKDKVGEPCIVETTGVETLDRCEHGFRKFVKKLDVPVRGAVNILSTGNEEEVGLDDELVCVCS